MVTYQGGKLIPGLAETLKSLRGIRTVLHDSGSTDGTPALAAEAIPGAVVITGENRGFGYGCNRCLERIETEYTLLLNSDARLGPESLSLLVEYLDGNPAAAGVQPIVRLWGWKPVTASRGVFLTPYGEAWDSGFMRLEPFFPADPFQVPAITAAVALWRTDALRSTGGFDEGFFMYFEDADLSLRAGAAGWKLAVLPSAGAEHMIGASSTRREAGLWELSSSMRIFRRYLAGKGFRRNLFSREARILAGNLARGRNPFPRLMAFLSGLRGEVDRIDLPDDLRSVLFGSSHDLPMARPQGDSPGWQGDIAAPWAGSRTASSTVTVSLESTGHAASGAILGPSGEPIRRFNLPAGGSRSYRLAVPGKVVYIKCDNDDDRIKAGVK